MNKEPIDYDSPLGVSKKEWTKVLGVNLALLLIVYAVALVCTLCGNGTFLLNFYSEDLQRIEGTLREWNMFSIVQMVFSTIEMTIISCYVAKAWPKWWVPISYFATYLASNFIFHLFLPSYPSIFINVVMIGVWVLSVFAYNGWKPSEKWFVYLFRLLIGLAISFILNEAIGLFRTLCFGIWKVDYSNSAFFALSVEYDLALGLTMGFLTLLIPWKRKGGKEECSLMSQDASGSSPTSTSKSPKPAKTAKTNVSPKLKRRLIWLKVKVMSIQTLALIITAALPWFAGKPVEFAMCYASFCFTRLILGFGHSLHFKSELSCVTVGALTFWALSFLSPSVEASIILSLAYGGATAIGFRLYWELHDLIMYRKASKTDRYAMLYVVFKGNVEPKRINGWMRSKGYDDKDFDIRMVQMYMQREKVEYIAEWVGYAKITVEKRLTEIANDLYQRR